MKRSKRMIVVPASLAALAAASVPAMAVPMAANTSALGAAGDTFLDAGISATDLVNTGQSTLSSVTTTRTPSFGFPGINNGVGATNTNDSTFYTNTQTPASVTFNLNTGTNTNGYTIQSISTFAGWTGVNITQANQQYEVLVSRVGDATFQRLGTFINAPFSASSTTGSSTRTIITDTTGVLADNVDRVRFNLIYPGLVGNNSNPGTVYRELDVAGIAASAAAPLRINLIQNGSFETPVLGAGANQRYTTATPFDANWTINGETTLVRNTFGTVASDGAQWLSLESNGGAAFPNNDATISQTISTIPGRQYDLIFDYSTLGNDSVSTPWQLSYNVGSGPINLLIGNTPGLTLGGWFNETYRFTATSALTTISFSGVAKVDGFFGPAIDNVGVFIVAIPEPATLSLGLVGFAGLMIRRRRVG